MMKSKTLLLESSSRIGVLNGILVHNSNMLFLRVTWRAGPRSPARVTVVCAAKSPFQSRRRTQTLRHSSDSDRNRREGRSHTDHPAGIRSCRRNLQIVDPSNGKGLRHFEKDIKSRSRTPTSSTTWWCYENSQNMSTSLLDAWVVMRRRLKFCKVSSSYVLCPGLTSRRHNYTCAASLLHIGLATPQHALGESSELDRVEIGCTSTRRKSNSVQGSRFYALLGHTVRRRSIPLLESCRFILDMVRQLVIRYTCEGWPHCSPHPPTPNPLPAPLPTVLRADVGL
jgi:hypothetical protein